MLDRLVLKENQTFLVSDPGGDIRFGNDDGQGLYWQDTRFLCAFELRVNGESPQLLAAAGEHNFMSNLQLANPSMVQADGTHISARTVSIRRNRFLHNGLHERLGFFNYNPHDVVLDVILRVASDFRDMFDVRGYLRRTEFGHINAPEITDDSVCFTYTGLDGTERESMVRFDRPAADIVPHTPKPGARWERGLPGISGAGDPRIDTAVEPAWADVHFQLRVPPSQYRAITITVEPRIRRELPAALLTADLTLDDEFLLIRDSYASWTASCTKITTDNEMVNAVIRRSVNDLRLLSDQVPDGFIPSAGIPWFSVPFGRDSLITSLQTLPLHPNVAYATLRFLAEHQGHKLDGFRDEEPGKILHEIRLGEAAALGQVPHTPYFGSVDSTPLFLITLSEYLRWTGDLDFGRSMRPIVERALEWIDRYGDLDGDGLVEYQSQSSTGIRNQGWKDSHDSIAFRDGRPVDPPIALCEVQGYVYDAKLRMAEYFTLIGESQRGEQLVREAESLQRRFQEAFWLPDERFYAMALGPGKEHVRSIGSNAGQALWSGIIDDPYVDGVVHRLMEDDLRCGWGVRTLSSHEPTFNPMSYHNGSVWPHDNSLIVAGLKRAGHDREAAVVAGEVLDAAVRFPSFRIPEVYCGFARDRRYFSMPAQYPVSCSPQAWAAASVFLIIQSVLGLQINAFQRRLTLRPFLPNGLRVVHLENLRVAGHSLDMWVRQTGDRVDVETSGASSLDVIVHQAAEAERPLPTR